MAENDWEKPQAVLVRELRTREGLRGWNGSKAWAAVSVSRIPYSRYWFFAVISMLILLSGCPSPVGYIPGEPHQITSRGGADTYNKSNIVRSIKKPAIWPTDAAAVRIAEVLQGTQRFTVITPAKTEAALNKRGLPASLERMTESELLAAFSAVCNETGADAVIAVKPEGYVTSVRILAFPTQVMKSTVIIYADIVLREPIDVSQQAGSLRGVFTGMSVGGPSPESDAALGDAVAQRVLKLMD